MRQSLSDIAEQLRDSNKKVQLIFAFNGSGKTRLSREFKNLALQENANAGDESNSSRSKILYYNAFTEDLFYWDNDLAEDLSYKLIIQPNTFTPWALRDQGLDLEVIKNFQRYSSDKLTPVFSETFSEVTFSYQRGNEEQQENVKLSKGEESSFIWNVFYTLLDQVVETLNIGESDERDTDQFDHLQHVFIDDPVSSLDDNHLIALAVDIAALIKKSYFYELQGLKFIVTTHNPLFYNVLCNEFGRDDKLTGWKARQLSKFRMDKLEDGSFQLEEQSTDSPFSYHLFLRAELQRAIDAGRIHKYHFNLLRNILEKTSTFLGYKNWEDLLPKTGDGTADAYAKRIVNWGSHSKHSGDEVRDLDEEDKRVLRFLCQNISEERRFQFKPETPATNGAGDAGA